ncbi:Spindle pole body component [Mycena chlorophos]|uniref:Spindle pole body component n=1 Tax=Mycena chlorophos TaxID=658473 RepID=A0A8H6T0G2_MYCCL|nr:Spindle pole body component [Mycena chlorophos]
MHATFFPTTTMPKLFAVPDVHQFDDISPDVDEKFPDFRPRFFMPAMLDKPQNPIIETLKLHTPVSPLVVPRLPQEVALLTLDPPIRPTMREEMWANALKQGASRSEIHSWDSLRPEYTGQPSPSPFLSEQHGLVVAAARYYVHPRIHEPVTELKYVRPYELLHALKKTVLGLESSLHRWDPGVEKFVALVAQKGARGIIVLDDKDETLSSSFMERFLLIGTLLRRLEILVEVLRKKFAKEGPTIHAFTHALSTILVYLRERLTECAPREGQTNLPLVAIWSAYEPYEDVLSALASLCGRAEHTPPQDYILPDHDSTNLLSLIYDHVQTHLDRRSSKFVTATLAFILTTVSHDYFQQISRSVGVGGDKGLPRKTRRPEQYGMDEDKEDEEDEETFEMDPSIDEQTFPEFFPLHLVEMLPAAQKSLILLRVAEPEHPLLRAPKQEVPPLGWFWTWNDVEGAWNGQRPKLEKQRTPPPAPALPQSTKLLDQFRVFDLEPGLQCNTVSALPGSTATLHDFIRSFPETLCPITPTLTHLTSIVLEPLAAHASTLSRALLSLFISPLSHLHPAVAIERRQLLQFKSHLQLLHSYLLLASPAFKLRLAAALFADSEVLDDGEAVPSSRSAVHGKKDKMRIGQRYDPSKGTIRGGQQWPVGLSFALLERGTWPPDGGDLAFFLRTVIIDSLGSKLDREDGGGRDVFWVEAEKRMGFAIRDLPTEEGHNRWLNPLSIEALDFLYIDYKPAHPLDLLITPDILSKYQRLFTHLLRIMRVQHALSAVFRMSRSAQRPLFPTLSQANKQLLHLRFIAQSFIQSLSSYVLDTAVGGNFEPFLARVSPPASTNVIDDSAGFADIFSLAKAHSMLLDDVLAACLLRSTQRVAGDLLRQALELVLDFAVLVGERWEGRLEEYQAAPLLHELAGRFKRRIGAVIKALKMLVEKGLAGQRDDLREGLKATGGVEALVHLVEKLSEWW